MKKLFLLLLVAAAANASTIPCATGAPESVTTLTGTNFCTLAGETIGNFKLDWSSPFTSVDVSITSAEVIGGEAMLNFAVTTIPGSTTIAGAWIRLDYSVSSPDAMDDVFLTNVVGSGIRVYESVCNGVIQGGSCMSPDGSWLAHISAGPGQSALAYFTPTNFLSTEKFIGLNDASVLSVSNGFSAPEPSTFLLGSGLLVLGMLKRRKKA